MELDGLMQWAAENKEERLRVFLTDVYIAARAKQMGPGAVQELSQYTHWTVLTINRLAMLETIPAELCDPELALGVYWCALQKSATPEEAYGWIQQAQEERWSLAQLKDAMGLKEERTPPLIAPTEADIVEWLPGIDTDGYGSLRVTLDIPGDGFPQDNPGTAKVRIWR